MPKTKTSDVTRRRPERKLSAVRKELLGSLGPIDKHSTLFKGADGTDGALSSEISVPTDEQIAKINEFTRKTVTADDVAVFTTHSCNDLWDRDDDRFRTDTVEQFAALPQPFSPIGKSYMVGHDYEKLPVGRIFDTGTDDITVEEATAKFLTNEVYIPRTEANKTFIENVDYGIYWAVSVGVVLDKSSCTICGAPFGRWWCSLGHEKGFYYDPESTETDYWGYPLPAEDTTAANVVKCQRELYEAKDFYELSQVFLGAQYMAQLAKDPGFKGIVKAASAVKSFPVVGLSENESKELPIPRTNPKYAEAKTKYEVSENEDGSITWTDAEKLVWVFDSETDEVACLGRSTTKEGGDGEGTEEGSERSGSDADGDEEGQGSGVADVQPEDSAGGSGGSEGSGEESAGGLEGEVEAGAHPAYDGLHHHLHSSYGAQGGDSTHTHAHRHTSDSSHNHHTKSAAAGESEEEENMDKAAVMAAAKAARLPVHLVELVQAAEGSGLDELLCALSEERVPLERKASIGDRYLTKLRGDAIAMYVKAHQAGKQEPVATTNFERVLTMAGDDDTAIEWLVEEQRQLAQAKFPNERSVRRTSFDPDPNKRPEKLADLETEPESPEEARQNRIVGRIHVD